MNTEALMEVVKNRLDINKHDENNPTTHSFCTSFIKHLRNLRGMKMLVRIILGVIPMKICNSCRRLY